MSSHSTNLDDANVEGDDVAGTLDDWKLVLFGTETSIELDDELDKDKPVPSVIAETIHNNAAPEARHNVVDAEGDPWTGSQQVDRVSHPEVQKPTTENQTSGCATFEAAGSGCLGGCLILLLLAYLTGVPGWRDLITSLPVSDNRSESAAESRIAATVVSTTTTSWSCDMTIGRSETCRCL